MTLATRYEVKEIEIRHKNFLNAQLMRRELFWTEAINRLTPPIFTQCHENCVPRELNLKTFNAFDPWGGVDVCDNFMINVFIMNETNNTNTNTNNAHNDDSGLTNVISLVNSTSSTINTNTNGNKYIYCLEYANANQTLKDAIESKSISTSLHISILLENAGFHKAWAKRHSSTPSLFFWRMCD
jgi:hypothetical protein